MKIKFEIKKIQQLICGVGLGKMEIGNNSYKFCFSNRTRFILKAKFSAYSVEYCMWNLIIIIGKLIVQKSGDQKCLGVGEFLSVIFNF